MRNHFLLTLAIICCLLGGCAGPIGDYVAASSISENGFARDCEAMRKLDGQEIKSWGFVDHANMYGDEGAKRILEEWWSGDGPNAATWRFDLKAHADDETGHSFAVHVANDAGRDNLLAAFVANARSQQPTQVFVRGRMFTFDAPTNLGTRTGLYLEVHSSQDHWCQLKPVAQ